MIAHTRRATRGTQSYPNAQPFVRELAGRAHLFAHNGDLQAYSNQARFRSITSTQLARPIPSWPFVFSSTKWRRSGRCHTQRRHSAKIPDRVFVCWGTEKTRTSKFLVFRWRYARRSRTPAKHTETGRLEAPGLMLLQRPCQSGQKGSWRMGSQFEATISLSPYSRAFP